MKPELFLQTEFSKWLDRQVVLYCASAGGMRVNMITAINMKRAGYKKGFPDIAIYERAGKYCGLFIEIKVNSATTLEQKIWCEELNTRGYKAVIMPKGMQFQEALNWLKECVNEYLSANKIRHNPSHRKQQNRVYRDVDKGGVR